LPFLFIDLSFLGANLLKVVEGGWSHLALRGLVIIVMYTWRHGSRLLFGKTRRQEIPLTPTSCACWKGSRRSAYRARRSSHQHAGVRAHRAHAQPQALQGCCTSTMSSSPSETDDALAWTGERVGSKAWENVPLQVRLRFGFMETPNVPRALAIARKIGWTFDIMSTSFFLSRRALKPAIHSGMPRWQDHLFIMLTRIANDATDYFQIPTGRVVEVGTQVTI
jgi:KUP system potassium uptake protein